jgi:hypothetical protein
MDKNFYSGHICSAQTETKIRKRRQEIFLRRFISHTELTRFVLLDFNCEIVNSSLLLSFLHIVQFLSVPIDWVSISQNDHFKRCLFQFQLLERQIKIK